MRSQRPLQKDGALLYFPVGRIVRSAELHSPLAEENCIIENVASLRSAKVDTPWRRYLRLSQKKIPASSTCGDYLFYGHPSIGRCYFAYLA